MFIIYSFLFKYLQYFHDENEITLGDKNNFYEIEVVTEIEAKVDVTVAVSGLMKLTPKQRKCRFFEEPNSELFDVRICKLYFIQVIFIF